MDSQELLRLVEGAGFIFRGQVIGHPAAPQERAVPGAEGQRATVAVGEILRSTEVMKGLAGREVILVGEHPSGVKQGSYVFFTTCLSLGEHAVLRDLGHWEASAEAVRDTAEAVRTAEEQPLQRRVAGAELIVNGRVASSHELAKPSIRRSEHDPDWWIARVTVRGVIKGSKAGKEIKVLFANSDDIAWYKSPKLHEGVSGVFLLRLAEPNHLPKAARNMFVAADPLDHLPAERLPEVERLLQSEKGDR